MNITGGKYCGRKIDAPDEKITRPTLSKAREGVFSTLYSLIDFEDKSFLDMFAGSGIMGLEALSRGFNPVYCIEKNISVSKILKSNYERLGIKPNFIFGDCLKQLPKINLQFDIIYIDPPYESNLYKNSLNIISEYNILNPNGIIILEHNKELSFEGFKLLKQKTYSQKLISFLVQ